MEAAGIRKLVHPEESVLKNLVGPEEPISAVLIQGYSLYTKKEFWINNQRIQKYVVFKQHGVNTKMYSVGISQKDTSPQLAALFNECEEGAMLPLETEYGVLMVASSVANLLKVPDNPEESIFIAQINLWQFGLISEPVWAPVSDNVAYLFNSILELKDDYAVEMTINILITLSKQGIQIVTEKRYTSTIFSQKILLIQLLVKKQ